ncbi:MAG TPA: acyltransferase family protein, partial [Roseiarcus sp.]|nr:acyltransferase family protein [Roseiarcus sp.]
MKRSASLDFLRGSAAFAVAIPHYLTTNAPFAPGAEAVAIVGVEVFFVLSGFVLAPQIVDWVVAGPWRNLGVFLARRWMRTIPPYVVALAAIALITGNLATGDTLRYLFYVENLAGSANATDYYPVAWSLAVEEWFYLLFAPLMFLAGRLLGRGDRRFEVAFAALFILAVAALRIFAAPHDWDRDVRRATVFRIDSIVWGYLLYLALEKRPFPALRTDTGRRTLAALAAAAGLMTALELGDAIAALGGSAAAERAFPYSSALFGMAAVAFFREADPLFKGRVMSAVGFTLGRISYSAYLFHIVIVMALKPRIADWPLLAQLALYVALVAALSTVFWRGFERPILALRPNYAPQALIRRFAPPSPASGRRDAPPLPLAGGGWGEGARPWLISLALALALIVAGALARDAFMRDRPFVFYPALVASACLAMALAERAGRFAGGFGAAARMAFLFALALPVADALYRSATGVPIAGSMAAPTYSYRAARENPAAFAMWWFYYLNEWIRDDGVRAAIEKPDPERKLPFVLVPGSRGRMFDTTIRINALGFRGPEIAPDKGDRFRIVALGESQTFAPTLRDGEKPWPELLQALFDRRASCGRPVEVVNAGTEAYTLKDNLVRMRRDVLPLKPDLVVSTHGMNGLLALGLRQVAEPSEPGVRPRASALIGRAVLTIERAVHDWRTRGAPRAVEPPPLSDQALLESRYAKAYRELIALGRASGVPVALATASMAVDASSPRDVKDFYGAVFKPIDDIIAANAAHNRLVGLIAKERGAPLIDMTPGLDGVWDDDLYLD